MPQLDFIAYSSVFWSLCLSLVVVLFLSSYYVLPIIFRNLYVKDDRLKFCIILSLDMSTSKLSKLLISLKIRKFRDLGVFVVNYIIKFCGFSNNCLNEVINLVSWSFNLFRYCVIINIFADNDSSL